MTAPAMPAPRERGTLVATDEARSGAGPFASPTASERRVRAWQRAMEQAMRQAPLQDPADAGAERDACAGGSAAPAAGEGHPAPAARRSAVGEIASSGSWPARRRGLSPEGAAPIPLAPPPLAVDASPPPRTAADAAPPSASPPAPPARAAVKGATAAPSEAHERMGVHAEWSEEGLRLWLRADPGLPRPGLLRLLLHQLLPRCSELGTRLVALVCNGEDVWSSEKIEGREARVPEREVPQPISREVR